MDISTPFIGHNRHSTTVCACMDTQPSVCKSLGSKIKSWINRVAFPWEFWCSYGGKWLNRKTPFSLVVSPGRNYWNFVCLFIATVQPGADRVEIMDSIG